MVPGTAALKGDPEIAFFQRFRRTLGSIEKYPPLRSDGFHESPESGDARGDNSSFAVNLRKQQPFLSGAQAAASNPQAT